MSPAMRKRFVNYWSKEYAAYCEASKLDDKIDLYNILGKPVKTLENKKQAAYDKGNRWMDRICEGIKKGDFPKDAVEQCKAELGRLEGYVGDCFYECYLDEFADE